MAKIDNLQDFLIDIADAIRTKKGTTDLINPQNFSEEILSIVSGGVNKFEQLVEGKIITVTAEDLKDVDFVRDGVFSGLEITSVELSNNTKTIGANAFADNRIQHLALNNGVTSIGSYAFANNQITKLSIPQNVTSIGSYAFAGNNLTEITMESDIPPIVTDTTFPNTLNAIYVSYNGYLNYVADANWQEYKAVFVRGLAIPSTITITVNNYLGELVSGANVTITGNGQTFTGTTNENGVFVQGDLQPATYTIEVADLDGFIRPNSQDIMVVEDSTNFATFTYLEKPSVLPFAEADTQMISNIADQIAASNMTSAEVESNYGWKLGDKTTITLTTGENIEMQIIGFNHDDKSDGSGKAGITLQMVNCLKTEYYMNSSYTNAGGYVASVMRTVSLPSIKSTIPQEWQNIIKFVDKKSANGGGTNYSGIVTSSEDLFLLSEIEVFGSEYLSQNGMEEGRVYDYWRGKSDEDRIKLYAPPNASSPTSKGQWWLRSSGLAQNYFCLVNTSGKNNSTGAATKYKVSFAFCV